MRITVTKVELILYLLLGGILRFNYLGSFTGGDLYILLMSPFVLAQVNFRKVPELKWVTLIYAFYFLIQLVSEIYLQNSFKNSARGLAVTFFSYFTFLFLFQRLNKDFGLIIVVLICQAILLFFFSDIAVEFNEESFESMSTFKFYIGPIISAIATVVGVFLLKKGYLRITAFIYVILGFVFILLDSRSSGLILLLIGVILVFGEYFARRRVLLLSSVVFLLLFSYVAYVKYVDLVLNHKLGGIHSYEQLKRAKDPYSPFYLLLSGRTEVFVGFVAIKEAPWLGHGTWARDKDGKYLRMMLKEHNVMHTYRTVIKQRMLIGEERMAIPTHSVIVGAGVYNGIFAALLMMALMLFFLHKTIKAIDFSSPYVAYLLMSLWTMLWTFLFSPISHLRFTLPLMFATILVLYLKKKSESVEQLLKCTVNCK